MKITLIFAFLTLLSISAFAGLKPVVEMLSNAQEIGPKIDCDPNATSTVLQEGDRSIPISVISEKYAQELFDMLKNRPEIPFLYPQDGCYARAHQMSLILEKMGIITGKVFVTGDLRVETPRSPDGYVEWGWHVAPIIMVRRGNKSVPMVIDPSIFQHPVTVSEWTGIQTRHPGGYAQETYRTNRYSYRPSSDRNMPDWSAEDLVHTQETMKRYSRRQERYSEALRTGSRIPTRMDFFYQQRYPQLYRDQVQPQTQPQPQTQQPGSKP
jgi:hypothetical protein